MNIVPGGFGRLEVLRAQYPLIGETEPLGELKRVILHNTKKHTDIAELLDFHRSRGFSGIGYHFAIDPDGRIFYTRSADVMGAHAYGRNRDSIGIAFLDIDRCASKRPAKRAFRQLYEELNRRAGARLPVESHTYCQFDFLDDRMDAFNDSHNHTIQQVEFDMLVTLPEIQALKSCEAASSLQRVDPSISDPQQYGVLRHLVNSLKICPGPGFFPFYHEVR